jgi:hypothetical protein
MAFWMDPLLLLTIGAAIAWFSKVTADGSNLVVYGAEILTLALTYLVSVGLFLNLSVFAPIWRLLGAETGTAFIINGLALGLVAPGTVWTALGAPVMFVAIVLFALYPVWLRLGVILGRVLLGRNRRQEGLVGLVRP